MRTLITLTVLAGITGAICLGVAAQSPAYVDESGILVEPFAWMASGRILIILFVMGAITSLLIGLFGRSHHAHRPNA